MILKILTYPSDVETLHKASAPAHINHLVIDELINDMFETMYEAGGVGLAAIQIGVPVRVFVMDTGEPYVFVNPKPPELQGPKAEKNEGCLSLPGVTEIVWRHDIALIEAQDSKGEWRKYRFTGLEAQCVQHEYEHLDGVIIPDHLSAWRRERLRKQLAKGKK